LTLEKKGIDSREERRKKKEEGEREREREREREGKGGFGGFRGNNMHQFIIIPFFQPIKGVRPWEEGAGRLQSTLLAWGACPWELQIG
jgi:hypothetical protein